MNAYIIMRGAYSDQYPVHVTLDKNKANEYCEYMNNKHGDNDYWVRDCGFEDFELNTKPLDMAYVYRFEYAVHNSAIKPQRTFIRPDGNRTYAQYKEREPSRVEEDTRLGYVNGNPSFLNVVISLDEINDELAMKTAIDMIAEFKYRRTE